ncbi:hypothetical protein HYU13_05325 [Candidatus Woesearchaeota archaeon]|nr:hypothetical protein [Candidatus Woesearchaeota archaeon]
MSITKQAESFVISHPSVKDCLKNGLINYSSLSRTIAHELSLGPKKDFHAILIACRRLKRKLTNDDTAEKSILEILKKSKVEIKNKVIAVVLERSILAETIAALESEIKKKKAMYRYVEGLSAITIITEEDALPLIRKHCRQRIITENLNLAEIIIKSPPEIEATPGTYAYLCSLFGENNINIVETLSCWTDTIFLISENDVGKAMQVLRF